MTFRLRLRWRTTWHEVRWRQITLGCYKAEQSCLQNRWAKATNEQPENYNAWSGDQWTWKTCMSVSLEQACQVAQGYHFGIHENIRCSSYLVWWSFRWWNQIYFCSTKSTCQVADDDNWEAIKNRDFLRTLHLKLGAFYKVVANLNTADGIVNGTPGYLRAIDFGTAEIQTINVQCEFGLSLTTWSQAEQLERHKELPERRETTQSNGLCWKEQRFAGEG